jgi:hypothetical protein
MMTAFPEVAAHLAGMGYSEGEIRSGLDLAEELEATTSDEALSIAVSRILLGEADAREGARFGIRPGSVDWESYK